MTYIDDLRVAVCEIARQAGTAILEVYEAAEGLEIETKTDNSPLTLADRKANAIICKGLERLDPVYPIISEENKEIPYAMRKNYRRFWLVDPLDGTKEFIKRNGEFTVNIALVEDGAPIMGVVYAPDPGELFWAIKERGAYRQVGQKAIPLEAPAFRMSDTGLAVVCSRSHLNEATQAFVDRLHQPKLVAKGSSFKFLMIARGEAHVYPRLGPTMEWDTGAAQIVLEEAGGRVVSEATKASLEYNKENLRNPHFIAYGRVQPEN